MIKLLSEEDVLKNLDKDYIIIVPTKDEVYYKNKFLEKGYKVFTFNNYIFNEYDGVFPIANDNQNFLFMYRAYLETKSKLKRYKNVRSLSFIDDLLRTYKDFFWYQLNQNDKVYDLKLIYNRYEALLKKEGLINRKLLFDEVLKTSKIDKNYAFLNVQRLSEEEYHLISKIKENKDVLLSIDGFDNELISKIKSIFKEAFYPYQLKLSDKKVDYYALNDIEEELLYVLNDISKKILNGSKYKDFIIICKDTTIYEPYFSLVFDFPYSKNTYLGILTSRFIKAFSNILKGDFSCENFINLLKLDVFDINTKDVDKLDNYIYEWNLEKESFYVPFISGKNTELLEELNTLRENIMNPLKCLLENIVGQTDVKVILKEFWTYLSEIKIDEKLFEKDPDGYNGFMLLSEDINDYFKMPITTEEFFNLISNLSKKTNVKNTFIDEVTISNIKDASYENKKYVYLIGADLDSLTGDFKPNGLLENNDLCMDMLINKINEFSSYEKAMFKRITKNNNVMVSYHKLSSDLSLKTPSLYLNGNLCEKDELLYDKKLIIDNYAKKLSLQSINVIKNKEGLIASINKAFLHNLDLKISLESAEKLYSKHLICSPSSIETYSKCGFYHFCQYGLRLKIKEKRLFDNREVGSLIHFVLENIIRNDFNDIDINNLEKKISDYAFKYLKDNNKLIDNVTKYVVKDLSLSTCMVIKNIISEKEVSSFKPRYVEFSINDLSVIKPITVSFNEGKMTVNGIADRIDVYETEDKYYYSIVDYKTGGKKLRLDDCLDGLNLQMLLYILAFKESHINITKKQVVPSAVLYYPALIKEEKISREQGNDEILKNISKKLLADGIINRDKEVLSALGEDNIGDYINVVSRGRINDEKTFGLDDLNLLFLGIKKKLKEIGSNILSGNVEVNPVKGRVNACDFCKYSSICGFDNESDVPRRLKNYKNSEVFKMLEGDYNA